MGAGFQSLILMPDENQINHMSQALWSYKKEGFLPHLDVSDKSAAQTPILTSSYEKFMDLDDIKEVLKDKSMLLVTSQHDIEPERLQSFDLCCEMLNGHNQQDVEAGRKRWARYKDAGFSVSYWAQDDQGRWSQKA